MRKFLVCLVLLAPTVALAVTPREADLDSGSGSVPTEVKGIAIPGSGGPVAVGPNDPLPVAIEYDASNVIASFYEAVTTGRGTYRPTLGGSAPYSKCTARNMGTSNPVCIKAKTGLTRGVIVSARSGATSPPDAVSFRNVSTLEIDTSTSGCSGGTTVEITCEQ